VFGLMVFSAVALYLALMFLVMRQAWRAGRAHGGSVGKASLFAGTGFLLVYLPVFWNHIPVLVAHREMCAKDGGFRAHVVPAQWIAQNQTRLSTLSKRDLEGISSRQVLPSGFSRYEHFGGLLATEEKTVVRLVYGIAILHIEDRILDVATDQVISVFVDYRVGDREDLRFWFGGFGCVAGDSAKNPSRLRQHFYSQLRAGVE
jgi:hypothetical protein